MNTLGNSLTPQNVVWGIDPKPSQMDFLTNLLSDEGFVRELETLLGGVKPNLKFYQGEKGAKLLALILEKFSDRYKILDAKCSDGINTEMGVIGEYRDRIDALTIAPASGDDLSYIELLQNSATGKKIDVISMGAMSFPGTISDLINGSYDTQKAKIARNLDAGIAGIVMGATAYNTNVVKELSKLKEKIGEGSIEHACLKGYSDKQLVNGILLRNKLFEEVIGLIGENNYTKILTPGFGRQGGSSDFFIPEFNHSERTSFNAGSDIIKGLENTDITQARSEVLRRLAEFLSNIQGFSTKTTGKMEFIVPEEYQFEKLLHTGSWWDLLGHIGSIYQRPEGGAYCRLASELLSDRYINIGAEPERNYLILQRAGKELAQQLSEQGIKADIVMGAQMGSVRLSGVGAGEMGIDTSIYTEKTNPDSERVVVLAEYLKDGLERYQKEKGDDSKIDANYVINGVLSILERKIPERMVLKRHDIDLTGKKVVLSEDIVTKGSTLEKMIEIVKEGGGEVVAITCVGNRYGKDNFNGIPLISCFVPPKFNMWWNEETLVRVRAKRLAEGKSEEEVNVEIGNIKVTYPQLPEGSKIAEKPKNVWNELVESMKK